MVLALDCARVRCCRYRQQPVWPEARLARSNPAQLERVVGECFGPHGEHHPKTVSVHTTLMSDFVDKLQDDDLAPGTVNNHVKGVKQFYRANGLRVELPYRLSKRVKFGDRSPRAEEIQKLLDVADIRGKVIVSMLAFGGFLEHSQSWNTDM